MNKKSLLVVGIVLAVIFFAMPKKKVGTPVADKKKTVIETKKSAEIRAADEKRAKEIIANASSPEEKAEREATALNPQLDNITCSPLDTRYFCKIFDVKKDKTTGIKVDRFRVQVRDEAEKYFDEARKLLGEVSKKGTRDLWTVATWLWIKDKINRDFVDGFASSTIVIALDTQSHGTSAVTVIRQGYLDEFMDYFDREFPKFKSSKKDEFFRKAPKYFNVKVIKE